ncbi:MAG: hypothetical protein LUG44_05335, partial [Clostridiales bacterium]|nr:hypothetical protein [Clostridiales bacterium]
MALDGWASRFCANRGAKSQESFVDFKILQRRVAQNKPSRRRELFNQSFPYKASIGLLYGVAYTIKMSKKSSHAIEGYFDYV